MRKEFFITMYTDTTRMPFYEAMQSLVGKNVAIQTGLNVKQGLLVAVFPDLVVLEVCQVPFYYRVADITWVTPLTEHMR